MRTLVRFLGVGAAIAVAASCVTAVGSPRAAAGTPAIVPARTAPAAKARVVSAKTSAIEKARVDAVKTTTLSWYSCYTDFKCATVTLPLDYDQPKGPQVEVAVLKRPANDRTHRIGSLFVNPGGPGGSGIELAQNADANFSGALLDRFDIVGFDPRGVGFSSNVRCFANNAQNESVLGVLGSTPFPDTAAETRAFIKATNTHAAACSGTGLPLTAAVSTAEVARDMDVLRRAVGDRKLNYLGFSYGSYLGQVYANLFPDRVRSLAIDGVINPTAWAGTAATAATPLGDRLRAADGASKALHEILVRCDRAGGAACSFAPGDPVANWRLIADRLKAKPLDLDGTYGYPELAGDALTALYYDAGADMIADLGSSLIVLTEPPAVRAKSTNSTTSAVAATRAAAARKAALSSLRVVHRRLAALRVPATSPGAAAAPARLGFPYDNGHDAFQTIACTDSLNAPVLASLPELAAAADRRAPYFGALWAWNNASCASAKWTATDEDAYRGPFNRRTVKPVLVVGNYWDPATNYAGAVAASRLLPNSRLLSSDSWGHTAYGSSDCVTAAVDRYLLKGTLPKKGKVCVGDSQPFDGSGTEIDSLQRRVLGPLRPTRR